MGHDCFSNRANRSVLRVNSGLFPCSHNKLEKLVTDAAISLRRLCRWSIHSRRNKSFSVRKTGQAGGLPFFSISEVTEHFIVADASAARCRRSVRIGNRTGARNGCESSQRARPERSFIVLGIGPFMRERQNAAGAVAGAKRLGKCGRRDGGQYSQGCEELFHVTSPVIAIQKSSGVIENIRRQHAAANGVTVMATHG